MRKQKQRAVPAYRTRTPYSPHWNLYLLIFHFLVSTSGKRDRLKSWTPSSAERHPLTRTNDNGIPRERVILPLFPVVYKMRNTSHKHLSGRHLMAGCRPLDGARSRCQPATSKPGSRVAGLHRQGLRRRHNFVVRGPIVETNTCVSMLEHLHGGFVVIDGVN